MIQRSLQELTGEPWSFVFVSLTSVFPFVQMSGRKHYVGNNGFSSTLNTGVYGLSTPLIWQEITQEI